MYFLVSIISFISVGELWQTSDSHEGPEHDNLRPGREGRAPLAETPVQRQLSQPGGQQTQRRLRARASSCF